MLAALSGIVGASLLVAAILLVTTNWQLALAAFAAGAFFAFLMIAPSFWLALVLVLFIPFHTLIAQLLGGHGSVARQFFVLWKEALLAVGLFRVLRHNPNRRGIIVANRWVLGWAGFLFVVYCIAFFRMPSVPGIFSLDLEVRFLGVMFLFMFLDLDQKHNAILLRAIVWSVGRVAVYGLVQYAWDYERLLPLVHNMPDLFADGSRRLYSFSLSALDPAYGAMVGILVLCSSAGRAACRRTLIWLAILVPCLLLTYTRSAYLGLLAGILVVWAVERGNFRRNVIVASAALVVICVALLLGDALPYQESLGRRIHSIVSQTDDSSMVHKERMQKALQVTFTNPFGIGLGKYGTVQARFMDEDEEPEYTENWVLQVAVQTGVVGAFAYLGLTGAIFVSLLRKRQRSKHASALKAVAVGVFVAMTVAAVMIPVWDALLPSVYAWALVGMALAASCVPPARRGLTRTSSEHGWSPSEGDHREMLG
jgi:hypothetical protein